MSWKLRNSKVLDELYLSELEKYNPDLIYHADDIIDGLKKLNKEMPNKKIMILRSNKSNAGFVCFNGDNCDGLCLQFEKIISDYKNKHRDAHMILNDYKKIQLMN